MGPMPTYLDIAKQALAQHISLDQREESKSKSKSYVFNEVNELTSEINDEAHQRIARLQTGQTWLLDQHHRWLTGDLDAAIDLEFSRVWNAWWDLDHLVRSEYGFKGCVLGPNGSCPDGFPCLGCCEAIAPGVVAFSASQ